MLSVVALAVIAGLLLWLLSGRDSATSSKAPESGEQGYEAMEAAEELRVAEEDVRDLDTAAQPGDDQPGDDWGPGTSYRRENG